MSASAFHEASSEVANVVSPPDDLFTRAEKALATSRRLRVSLKDQQSAVRVQTARNRQLAADLRDISDRLSAASQGRIDERVAVPQLTARCNETGRVRLVDDHAELAKESLARMAAQLAGREPDERVRVELGGCVAFDDQVWRYHDFVDRAERAFLQLAE